MEETGTETPLVWESDSALHVGNLSAVLTLTVQETHKMVIIIKQIHSGCFHGIIDTLCVSDSVMKLTKLIVDCNSKAPY